VKTGELMRPDARIRIQSNSKTWLAAVAFQFANEGRLALGDTVEDWLPGLLPFGHEMTVGQLMSDTSGLVDDNDIAASPPAFAQAVANVGDAELAANLTALFEQVEKDRSMPVDPVWLVRLAAWQPLVLAPGAATTTRTSVGTSPGSLPSASRGCRCRSSTSSASSARSGYATRATNRRARSLAFTPRVTWYAPTGA
jgi:CubicO group peptidase (beta-lactamase class C family)